MRPRLTDVGRVSAGRIGGSTAAVCAAAACALVLSACSTSGVRIVNDTHESLRLSGCFIDDSLDLKPSEAASQDVPSGRWGCSVYRYPQGFGYEGCLVIQGGDRTYMLSTAVRAKVTSKECDRM